MRYRLPAIVLHWLIALLVLLNLPLGAWVEGLRFSPQKLAWMSYHKWIGITVLGLMIARLAWRLTHTPPDLPTMPVWKKRLAVSVHHLFYGALFLIPLTGWWLSSAKGIPVVYLGWFTLPDWIGVNPQWAEFLAWAHEWLNRLLLLLLVLHLGGVWQHQFVQKDGLLWRMLPMRRK